ncbi:MAG: ABC transporter substrate-binding protein [Sciscionella sp.]
MRVSLLFVACLLALTAGCTGPGPTGKVPANGTSMVLAVGAAPVTLDPLAGYAPHGAAKIFDGLLEYQRDGSLRPALAAAMPEPAADGRSWTVKLRTGVKFSDGSAFGAADVVATYRALLNPRTASPLRSKYSMLSGVRLVDATTVRFDLAYPYLPFQNLLVLGILPSESLARPRPVATSPQRTHPVGTGPYQVVSFQPGKKLVLKANRGYFSGAPKVTKVTVLLGQSDAVRAREVRQGKVDGTPVPATMAKHLGQADSYQVIRQRSAEFRAVSLPARGAVTGDLAMREALNYAADRKSIVDGPLAGAGSVASTPITDVQPEFSEPSATFAFDKAKAQTLLQQGGWQEGADGVRARHGVRAAITLDYRQGDTVARALASAFAHDAAGVGVSVTPHAIASASLAGRAGHDAELISAGNPFDPGLCVYPLLHTGGAANHMGYSDAAVDTVLDTARRERDPGQRAVEFRQLQREYLADPAMVVLARLDHSYLQRDGWKGYQAVTDAGDSAPFTWGPWWNLRQWSPQ